MNFKPLAAAAIAIGTLATPAKVEIVPSKCTLAKFYTTSIWDLSLNSKSVERFDCLFKESDGNVTVDSRNWAFTFLIEDQGTGFIRIDTTEEITFNKTGHYSLKVKQRAQVNE